MQTDLIAQAQMAFEEAMKLDETRARLAGAGKASLAARAQRTVDKHLERAVALEAAAFGGAAVTA